MNVLIKDGDYRNIWLLYSPSPMPLCHRRNWFCNPQPWSCYTQLPTASQARSLIFHPCVCLQLQKNVLDLSSDVQILGNLYCLLPAPWWTSMEIWTFNLGQYMFKYFLPCGHVHLLFEAISRETENKKMGWCEFHAALLYSFFFSSSSFLKFFFKICIF